MSAGEWLHLIVFTGATGAAGYFAAQVQFLIPHFSYPLTSA